MNNEARSWEMEAVDEIIAAELRQEAILREMDYLEYRMHEAMAYGDSTWWFEEKLDDLDSELSDLQKAIGHE